MLSPSRLELRNLNDSHRSLFPEADSPSFHFHHIGVATLGPNCLGNPVTIGRGARWLNCQNLQVRAGAAAPAKLRSFHFSVPGQQLIC
jgi:hypothetical protein